MNMKIFIQIASFCDPQLPITIEDCIKNAKKPENLVFSIARQYNPDDSSDSLEKYKDDKRFKVINRQMPNNRKLLIKQARKIRIIMIKTIISLKKQKMMILLGLYKILNCKKCHHLQLILILFKGKFYKMQRRL